MSELVRQDRTDVRLAVDEDDRLDRYPPTVRYLQKLGPTELDLIFETSKWVFKEDPKMALQVRFCSDRPTSG
jgi:hypothetical protein